MNPSTPYNPFQAAAQAAIAELTSEQAQRFYALKAQQDVQDALDRALTILGWIVQLSELVYHLGTLSRVWCDAFVAHSQCQPIPSSLVLAPAAPPLALLAEAPPKVIRLPGSLSSRGEVLITPAPAGWEGQELDRQRAAEAVPAEPAGQSRQTRSTARKRPSRRQSRTSQP